MEARSAVRSIWYQGGFHLAQIRSKVQQLECYPVRLLTCLDDSVNFFIDIKSALGNNPGLFFW